MWHRSLLDFTKGQRNSASCKPIASYLLFLSLFLHYARLCFGYLNEVTSSACRNQDNVAGPSAQWFLSVSVCSSLLVSSPFQHHCFSIHVEIFYINLLLFSHMCIVYILISASTLVEWRCNILLCSPKCFNNSKYNVVNLNIFRDIIYF